MRQVLQPGAVTGGLILAMPRVHTSERRQTAKRSGTPAAVLTAFFPCFGRFFTVVFEVAAAVLSAFTTSF